MDIPAPIAVIHWADAHCGNAGWQDMDDYTDDGEYIITTVGFLIDEEAPGGKRGHVTVWQTITEGDGIHPFHIPVGMVRNVKILSTETIDIGTPVR